MLFGKKKSCLKQESKGSLIKHDLIQKESWLSQLQLEEIWELVASGQNNVEAQKQ